MLKSELSAERTVLFSHFGHTLWVTKESKEKQNEIVRFKVDFVF